MIKTYNPLQTVTALKAHKKVYKPSLYQLARMLTADEIKAKEKKKKQELKDFIKNVLEA